jgi:hypothetical protein
MVLLLAASGAIAGVDPGLLGLVMPDAKALAGVQVDQAQASAFGRYLLGQFQAGGDFDKMVAASGFDPRRDLHEVLAATTADNHSLVLVRAVFQPSKITALAIAGGATSSSYRGIEVLTGKNSAQGFAFLDANTAAVGDTAMVKGAIDRRGTGAAFSGPLADKARAVSGANDAWVATLTPFADFAQKALQGAAPQNSVQANALATILQFSGGVRFGGGSVTLNGEALARSPQDAQSLADVLKFLASMAQAGGNDANQAKLGAVLNGAIIAADGPVLRVSLSVPEQQLEDLIKPQPRRAVARVRR